MSGKSLLLSKCKQVPYLNWNLFDENMDENKAKVLLKWCSLIHGKEIKTFECLNDGKILKELVKMIPKKSSYRQRHKDLEDDETLESVRAHLEDVFHRPLDAYFNVHKAVSGDTLELCKCLLLIIIAGINSEISSTFVNTAMCLDHQSHIDITKLLQKVSPKMTQIELTPDFYQGLLVEPPDPVDNKPKSSSTPLPNRNCTSPEPTESQENGTNILAAYFFPYASPINAMLDESMNSMITQREQRLKKIQSQLLAEQKLRSEIQFELQHKESLLDQRDERISELVEKLKESRRKCEKLESDYYALTELIQADQKVTEERKNEIRKRNEELVREATDLKESNAYLEKENNKLHSEVNRLQSRQASQMMVEDLRNQVITLTDENMLLQDKVVEYKSTVNSLQIAIKDLKDELAEVKASSSSSSVNCERNPLNNSRSLDKSVLSEPGECLGDVIEMKLKDELSELNNELTSVKQSAAEKEVKHEEERTKLTTELQSINKLNEQFKADVVKLQETESTITARINELLAEQKLHLDMIGELNRDLEKTTSEIEQNESTIKQLTESLNEIQSKHHSCMEKIICQESQIATLKDEKSTLTASLDDLKLNVENMDKKIEMKVHEMKNLEEQLVGSKEKVTSFEIQLTEEKDKVKLLKEQKKELLEVTFNLHMKIQSLEDDVSQANTEVTTLQTELKSTSEVVDGLKQSLAVEHEKISTLSAELELKDRKIDELQEINNQSEEKLIAMNDKESQIIQLISQLDAKNSEMIALRDELNHKTVEMEQELEIKNSKIDELEDELKKTSEEHTKCKQDVDSLNEKLVSLSSELESKNTQIIVLENTLAAVTDNLASIKEESAKKDAEKTELEDIVKQYVNILLPIKRFSDMQKHNAKFALEMLQEREAEWSKQTDDFNARQNTWLAKEEEYKREIEELANKEKQGADETLVFKRSQEELQAKYAAISAEHDKLATEHDTLTTEYQNLKSQLTSTRTDLLLEKELRLSMAEKENADTYKKMMNTLEDDLEKMKLEVEATRRSRRALEAENEQMKKELVEISESNQFNKQHHGDLEALIDALQERLSQSKHRGDVLFDKVNELEENKGHLEKEIATHVEDMKKMKVEFDSEVAMRKKRGKCTIL